MKTFPRILVCLVAVFALVAVAEMAAAETVNVPAGGTQSSNLGSMNQDDLLTLSWSSNVAVSAVLTGPSGYSHSYSSSIYGWDIITVPHSGAYTLTFTNSGSTAATVDLTFSTTPFSPVHEATNMLMWIAIIAGIIIVAVVVVVVLVVVMGGKKKKAAAQGVPPGIVVPTVAGMCPVCGAQTDTNALFCAKCGARFH